MAVVAILARVLHRTIVLGLANGQVRGIYSPPDTVLPSGHLLTLLNFGPHRREQYENLSDSRDSTRKPSDILEET